MAHHKWADRIPEEVMLEDTYTEDLAGVYVHSTRSPDVKRIR